MPASRWETVLAGALAAIVTRLETLEGMIERVEEKVDQPDWRERQ